MELWGQSMSADAALFILRWNWGSAYEIDYGGTGRWQAQRRDGRGGELAAADPRALRDVILRDYELDPVPRCA
jgi:hypothetical protein